MAQRPPGFREVFAVGEFRALLAAQSLSTAGDQLARLALAILVYADTGSPVFTAVGVALTYVPELLGGPLLSGLADRYPRREVMVVCDLLRASLIAAAAIPGLPLPVLWLLVFLVQAATAPARAARSANMSVMLGGDRYTEGLAVMSTAAQIFYFAGFALGGVLVSAAGPHVALLVDAGTFVVSALLVRFGLRWRPASRRGGTMLGSVRAGVRLVWGDRRLRALVALAWIYGFYVAPLGLAVPYADQIGAGTVAAGLFLAAEPIGSVAGGLLLARLVPADLQHRLLGPLTLLTGVPLMAMAFAPPAWPSLMLLVLSGVFVAYQVIANATFVMSVAVEYRGQGVGLAASGLFAAQGLGILGSGLLAEAVGPAASIAAFAAAGVLAAVPAWVAWQRATRPHEHAGKEG
ncbi:MFS transporter [Thermoactinospora rubra]|uniref:MFS transporter n=1 Tax=Thermoactinospora rubra TaxID=1088767 RepID=UPI000A10AE2E|nr:MFS transporter [Thermoactinospora rubra]